MTCKLLVLRHPSRKPLPRAGVNLATFVYDGDGNRIKSTVSGVTTTYLGNWFEWSGSVTTKVRYYSASGQRLAMRVGNGTATSPLTSLLGDHLGSTSLTFKAYTYATTTQRYKPWGEIRYQSGTLPTNYTYTGQYSHIADFGLMDYVARWDDPVLGRFAQADTLVPGAGNGNASSISQVANQMYTALTVGYYETPVLAKLNRDNLFIQMHGGLLNFNDEDKKRANIVDVPLDTQVFDRYSYALNNPLRFVDPTGHISGGNEDFGYDWTDNIITLWYFGRVISFNSKKISGTDTMGLVILFMLAADQYVSNIATAKQELRDLFVEGGITAFASLLAVAGMASCFAASWATCAGGILSGGAAVYEIFQFSSSATDFINAITAINSAMAQGKDIMDQLFKMLDGRVDIPKVFLPLVKK